jgi:hypothetical protein
MPPPVTTPTAGARTARPSSAIKILAEAAMAADASAAKLAATRNAANRRSRKAASRVTGLVDRLHGGDRDAAGGQIDGDALDAGDPADLFGHDALAVAAAHAADPERGDADEGAWRVFEHVVLRAWCAKGSAIGSTRNGGRTCLLLEAGHGACG